MEALADDNVSLPALEQCAQRLELLADAYDKGDVTLSGLLEQIADLRRAPEWRAERKAEWERTKPKPRVVYANQLAATCWREEPVPDRLRRIDQVMGQIADLAREAEAEGDFSEAVAIREHASSVFRLREALDPSGGEERT